MICSNFIFQTSIRIKILSKPNPEDQMNRLGQIIKKCETTAGDKTGTIKLTIWENDITKIEMGQSYSISNISTRNFDGLKSVTTTPDSMINNIEDIGPILNTPQEITSITETIMIETISCTQKHVCSVCFKDIGTFNSQVNTVKCNTCNMRQQSNRIKPTFRCEMIVSGNIPNKRLVIPHSVLQNNPRTNQITSTDDMEDFFLEHNVCTVELNKNALQVASIISFDK